MILIISCSLSANSRSYELARVAHAALESRGTASGLLDLRQYDLPFCDAGSAYGHPALPALGSAIASANGILLAAPVYNYDLNAVAKNLLELTGKCWTGKVVGFACAAGGEGSYMSVMPFANSLMLDYRCVIVPRFVYATGDAFADGTLQSPEVRQRIESLATDLSAFSDALTGLTEAMPQGGAS